MASAFLYGTVIGSGQPVSWIKYAYLLLVRMYSSASRQIPLAVLFCFCGFLRSFVRYMIRTNNPQSDNEHECCHVEWHRCKRRQILWLWIIHVNFVNSVTPIRSRDSGYHCCTAFSCVILCNV